jgi:hypothetical protein
MYERYIMVSSPDFIPMDSRSREIGLVRLANFLTKVDSRLFVPMVLLVKFDILI